jgi:hypothetical protein
MRLKLNVKLIVVILLVSVACPAFSQSAPAAIGPKAYSPLAVGAGFSDYDIGWQSGKMLGGTLWIDYTLPRVPRLLNGLGLEIEARDLSIETKQNLQFNMREDVASGGVYYSYPRYSKFRPYGKYLMGFGNDDYPLGYRGNPMPYHQTRTVTSMGGGLDYRAYRGIWLRADYEYQFWPDFWKHTNRPAGILSPSGITIGAMYHFGSRTPR